MNKKNGDLYAVIFENNHSFIPSLLNYLTAENEIDED
jgi:hypothetical protein